MDGAFIDYSEHITTNDPSGRQALFLYRRYLNFKDDYEALRDSGTAAADTVDFVQDFIKSTVGVEDQVTLMNLVGKKPDPVAHSRLAWHLMQKDRYQEAETLMALAFAEEVQKGSYNPMVDWSLGWMEVSRASASIDFDEVYKLQVSSLTRVLRILTALKEGHVTEDIRDLDDNEMHLDVIMNDNQSQLKDATERLLNDARALL